VIGCEGDDWMGICCCIVVVGMGQAVLYMVLAICCMYSVGVLGVAALAEFCMGV